MKRIGIMKMIVTIVSLAALVLLLLVNLFGMMELITLMKAVLLAWFVTAAYYSGYMDGHIYSYVEINNDYYVIKR